MVEVRPQTVAEARFGGPRSPSGTRRPARISACGTRHQEARVTPLCPATRARFRSHCPRLALETTICADFARYPPMVRALLSRSSGCERSGGRTETGSRALKPRTTEASRMSTAWVARHGLTSAQYQMEFDKLIGQGYRLVEVSGYAVANVDHYAAIWEKAAGPAWVSRHGHTAAQYQSAFDTFVAQGYRLVHVDGYTVNDTDRYAAIWAKATGPAWVARHGMTSAQYQAEFDKFVAQGFRLTHVSGYAVGEQPRFAAIWEKSAGPAWQARHGLTSAEYQSVFNTLVSQGYRVHKINGYTIANEDRYAAIFVKVPGRGWVARHGMTPGAYQGEFDNRVYQGYRLKTVSGYAANGSARYAAVWESDAMADADLSLIDGQILSYMNKHAIPGLSIAISQHERLVYAEGFGDADTTTREKVNPRHLFRIASISKPITAVAAVDLVEAGKLELDQRVFGTGALLGTLYGTTPYS